ncbi:Hypothetical predicted protein [Paramuricea clavata]|uniref:Uncharacterized protein n=1 Tax=Paramuricea clavata TaxID=317549 RepID=A0A6S7G5X5_PARCT|nr:Hypothetical predicted protein [Paramuricea clavata]
MLKKYIERKNADDVKNRKQELDGDDDDDDGDDKGDSVGGPVLHLTAASITETSIGRSNGEVDDEELLELGPTALKETAADMVLGERLTEEQRVQLEELIDRYEHIFTDVPGKHQNRDDVHQMTEHQIQTPIDRTPNRDDVRGIYSIQTLCNTLQRERVPKGGYPSNASDGRDQRI